MNMFKKLALGLGLGLAVVASASAQVEQQVKQVAQQDATKSTLLKKVVNVVAVPTSVLVGGAGCVVDGFIGGAILSTAATLPVAAASSIPLLALGQQSVIMRKAKNAGLTISFNEAFKQSYKNLFLDKKTTLKTLRDAAILTAALTALGTVAGGSLVAFNKVLALFAVSGGIVTVDGVKAVKKFIMPGKSLDNEIPKKEEGNQTNQQEEKKD